MHRFDATTPIIRRSATGTPGTRPPRTRHAFAVLGLAGLLTLSACANDGDAAGTAPDTGNTATGSTGTGSAGPDASGTLASASVRDTDGKELGTVDFAETDGDAVEVRARFSGMEPGFYGFHVHGTGVCEPDSSAPDDPGKTGAFLSAGGHLGSEDAKHPDHAGDLPSLLVTEAGDAHLTFRTDRLTAEDLTDEDGSSVLVHEHTENYANVPQRYSSTGPDEETLKAGDAGSRLACGVVESTRS